MARITTYTLDSNISLNDKLVGTDADDNSLTKNYSIDALGDGLISLKDIITGTGTLNTIPMFTPDGQIIGDSIITQASNGQGATVNGGFDVVEDLNVTGSIETSSGLEVAGNATFFSTVTFNDNITIHGDTTFEGEANFQSVVKDENSQPGLLGQVLTSTGNAVLWKNLNAISEVKTTNVTVTSAQLLALNGGGSVELIEAPGEGKVIIPISICGFLDFNTTAYVSSADAVIKFRSGTTGTFGNISRNTIESADDIYFAEYPGATEVEAGSNAALYLFTDGSFDLTAGDSPITLSIAYRIVDFS